MSVRTIERLRKGVYEKRVELAFKPPHEVINDITNRYNKGVARYLEALDNVRPLSQRAPEGVRARLIRAVLHLVKKAQEGSIPAAQARYETYKRLFAEEKVGDLFDDMLKTAGIYNMLVTGETATVRRRRGGGAGGGGGGGPTPSQAL